MGVGVILPASDVSDTHPPTHMNAEENMETSQYHDSGYDNYELTLRRVQKGKHREIIGGMWEELGLLQFNFLRSHDLQPDHTLIDVGCGSLRGGVHFVEYLNVGNYYGMDNNQSLLDAGYDVELAAAGLQRRLPRANLICNADFDFSSPGRKFDFALAQSVFTHLSFNRIRQCLERLSVAMAAGGIFYATFFELPEDVPSSVPRTHDPGGTVTYGSRDPYHYRFADFEHACRELPWTVRYIGDWNHSRAQRMVSFQIPA